MRIHHTKFKGDIGLTQVIADLTAKGYGVSLPISEHLSYDLIVDKFNILKRVQVKYRTNSSVNKRLSYSTSKGCITHYYTHNDFEIYGMFIPTLNKCIYIPNLENQNGLKIRFDYPKNNYPFYWWEDFLEPEIKAMPPKRKLSQLDFNFYKTLNFITPDTLKLRKVINRPSYENLKIEIETYGYVGTGKKYGVSDNAIRKWEKQYKKMHP